MFARKPPARPKLGPFVSIIDAILAADLTAPPKQRHTAKADLRPAPRRARLRRRLFDREGVSHYLFDRFGRPGKGNDKGKVEGLVKNGRRRFLTPVPAATSFEALNAKLEADCLSELDRSTGSRPETIGVRLQADLAAFRPLPSGVFEPCTDSARVVDGARSLPVFGVIKSVLGFRQFLLRELAKVKAEWTLVTLAWNMKRMFALKAA
jgi:hypothetical protein